MTRKFTENQRCMMLADFIEAVPVEEIAWKYGVSESYVYNLAYRSGYKTPHRHRIERAWQKAREVVE